MIIDFANIAITDMSGEELMITDCRKDFANLIYRAGQGMESHALAHKIYDNEGPMEYTESEIEMIKAFAQHCSPAFIDAINNILK